jgi:hypothetical protein
VKAGVVVGPKHVGLAQLGERLGELATGWTR